MEIQFFTSNPCVNNSYFVLTFIFKAFLLFAVAPDPVSNCTVINKSSETFHLQCVPGFDGGMEQIFLVTVTERATGEIQYNQTTRR